MICHLKVGDRVEQPDVKAAASHGIVEYADDYYVRIKWDDGQIGLLYFDESMMPNARRLTKLAQK